MHWAVLHARSAFTGDKYRFAQRPSTHSFCRFSSYQSMDKSLHGMDESLCTNCALLRNAVCIKGQYLRFPVCSPLFVRSRCFFVKTAEGFLPLFAARRRFDSYFSLPTISCVCRGEFPPHSASVDMVYITLFT